jgi:hypothetical protein
MKSKLMIQKLLWSLFFLCTTTGLNADVYDWYWNNYGCEPECCNPDWYTIDRYRISAEALYWKASENNLVFGLKETNTTTTNNFVNQAGVGTSIQRRQELDFKWKPGFRVDVESLLPWERWYLGATWTYFSNNADGDATAKDLVATTPTPVNPAVANNFLVTTFLIPNAFSTNPPNINVNKIDAHWHLNFDNYELRLGKRVGFLRCFDFLLFAGVKYLNVEQRLHLEYKINQDPANPNNKFGTLDQTIKSRFSGVGLQAGLDMDWNLGCGCALYTKAAGGVAYGRARVSEFLFQVVNIPNAAGTGTQNLYSTLRDTNNSSTPNVDFAIGARWKHNFADCFILGMRLAWEYHHYFNQNLFRNVQDNDPGRGDLILQGATFAIDLNF